MTGDLHPVIPEGRPVPRAESRSAAEADEGFGARAQAVTARFGTALVARLRAARERRALVRTVRMAEAQAAASSATAAPARQKKTGREMRWERRRRRIIFEEVLGWILVPVILFGG